MRRLLAFFALCALTACEAGQFPLPGEPLPTNALLDQAKQDEAVWNFGEAQRKYQQLLDKEPTNKDYAYGLAESLRRGGKLDEAIIVYSQLLNADPNHVDAHEGKGLSYLAKADMDNASMSFAEVMNRDGNRWRTLNAVGVLFAAKQMYPEARQYLSAALERSENNPTILNNLGLIFALERDYFSALKTFEKAVASSKNQTQTVRLELNMALIAALSGDMKRAEALASKHLEGSRLNNNLGLYAHMAKDSALAKTYLNMALSESTVYYAKAWDNLQSVEKENPGTPENATEKSSKKRR